MRRLTIPALVLACGCNQDLPVYSLVEDLRVLAMRAEPPLFLFDEASGDVVVDALVVDPRGGPVSFAWSFCPVESNKACTDFADQLALAQGATSDPPAGDAAALLAAHAVSETGAAVPSPEAPDLPAAEPLRPYTVASFTIPHEAVTALQGYFEANGFYGFGMGSWPSAVLTLARPGDGVTAQKRVVVSVADLSVYNALLKSQLGYSFCPDPESARCIPWDPALAGNHNPVFEKVQYSKGKSPLADWLDLPPGNVITMQHDEEIRILPTFTPESPEDYQTLRSTLQTGQIEVERLTEKVSVSWFVTDGKVQDPLTWPEFTKTLDTVYTAPSRPPESTGGLVTVWMVGRDQRGGEAWAHVDIQITP
jgi:hypothetical protein